MKRMNAFIALMLSGAIAACGGGSGDSGSGGFGVSGGGAATGSGSGTGSGGGIGNGGFVSIFAPFQPGFEFTFEGVEGGGGPPGAARVERKVTLSLQTAPNRTATAGTFVDSSLLTRSAGGDFNITASNTTVTGSFNEETFSLAAADGKNYKGTFVGKDVIVLDGSAQGEAPVRLARNSNDQFKPSISAIWTFPADASRRLQLTPSAGFFDDDVTLLIEGTEFLAGQTSAITGYASVTEILLTIARPTGPVKVTGSARTALNASIAEAFEFNDSTVMQRGGTPDAVRSVVQASDGFSTPRKLYEVDLGGLLRTLRSGDDAATADVREFLVSPDGSEIAFTAGRTISGGEDLFVLRRNDGSVRQLTQNTATGKVHAMRWQGSRLAVISEASATALPKLQIIPSDGQAPTDVVTLLRATGAVGYQVAWATSGNYLAFVANPGLPNRFDVHVADSNGQNVRVIQQPATATGQVFDLAWSPSSDLIAYSGTMLSNKRNGYVAAVGATISLSPFVAGGGDVEIAGYRWAPDGANLGYVSAGAFTKFNPLAGNRQLLFSGVAGSTFEWSPNSSAVAFQSPPPATWQVWSGSAVLPIETTAAPCGSDVIAWAPANDRVAYFSREAGATDCRMFVYNFASGTARPISQAMSPSGGSPIRWAADGRRVVYTGAAAPAFFNALWVSDIDGSAALKISDTLDGSRVVYADSPLF